MHNCTFWLFSRGRRRGRRILVPAPLPAGGCPSSRRSHFSLSASSMSEAPSQPPQPQWPEISLLFCFLYGFSQSPTANSLPPTSAFFFFLFVCVCGAAQMLLHTHTHSLRRCCFPSALRCPQLLTIAAFFCIKSFTAFQPSFPLPPLIPLLRPILFSGWVGWFGSGSFAFPQVGCDGFQVSSAIPH